MFLMPTIEWKDNFVFGNIPTKERWIVTSSQDIKFVSEKRNYRTRAWGGSEAHLQIQINVIYQVLLSKCISSLHQNETRLFFLMTYTTDRMLSSPTNKSEGIYWRGSLLTGAKLQNTPKHSCISLNTNGQCLVLRRVPTHVIKVAGYFALNLSANLSRVRTCDPSREKENQLDLQLT